MDVINKSEDAFTHENTGNELDEQALREQEEQEAYEEELRRQERLQLEYSVLKKRHIQSHTALEQDRDGKRKTADAIREWQHVLEAAVEEQDANIADIRTPIRALQSVSGSLARSTESLEDTLAKSYEINLAASKLTFLMMQYTERFKGYNRARRIVEGCLRAIDAPGTFIRDPVRYMEEVYLECSDYWLAYAGSAVVFYSYGNREGTEAEEQEYWHRKAGSMEHHALLIDAPGSQLFFMLTDLSRGRIEEAQNRGITFLSELDAQNVDPSFQFLLQAYLQGGLGESPALLGALREYYGRMRDHAQRIDPAYPDRIVQRTREYAESFAIPDVEQFAMLRSCCPSSYAQMRSILRMARKNEAIFRHLEKAILWQGESARAEERQRRLRSALLNLIRRKTPEEQKLLEEIERCSAVIRAEGDTLEAERWSRQREKESGQRYLLPDLLFRWALEDDEQRTDPEVRCFSIMKLCGLLADGFLEFAGQYREKYQDLFRNGREGFLIEIGGWKATCFPSRVTEAEYSLRRHTIRTLPRRILSDPYAFFAMGAWIVSLIVFLIAAGRHAPLIVTASILTGVISIAAIILRARGLWINLLDDCSVYTETLNAVMEQAVFWEEAYQEADRWNDDLLSLIEGCRGMEDLII